MLVVLCVRNITVFELLLMKANTFKHTYIHIYVIRMYVCIFVLGC